uniref:Retinol dehydrogenase 1 n=1 Tax=Sinocyclocheilus rhinocerous TaxID=307959 RepID=A0A673KEC6_9TELE
MRSLSYLFLLLLGGELGRVPNKSEKFVFITGCDTGFGNLLKGEVELKKCCSDKLTTLHLDVTNNYSIKKAADTIKTLVGEKGMSQKVIFTSEGSFDTEDWTQLHPSPPAGVLLRGSAVLLRFSGRSRICIFTSMSNNNNVSKIILFSLADIRRDMMHFGVNGSITEPGFFKTQVTDLSLTEDDLKKRWSNLPTEVRRAYGDSYLQDYIKLQEFSMKILASSDLSKVTSCMQHALSARYPQTHYSLLDSPLVPAYMYSRHLHQHYNAFHEGELNNSTKITENGTAAQHIKTSIFVNFCL